MPTNAPNPFSCDTLGPERIGKSHTLIGLAVKFQIIEAIYYLAILQREG